MHQDITSSSCVKELLKKKKKSTLEDTTKRHDWTTTRNKMCPVLSVITFAVMCICVGKRMLLVCAAHPQHSTVYEVEKESFFLQFM